MIGHAGSGRDLRWTMRPMAASGRRLVAAETINVIDFDGTATPARTGDL
jgi:hypothetical protein